MGSYESIFNDTSEIVETWYTAYGHWGPVQPVYLYPGSTTPNQKFSLSLRHEVCVKYDEPFNTTIRRQTCVNTVAPALNGRRKMHKVSQIIGVGTLPWFKAPDAKALSARQQQDCSFEYFMLVACALAAFMFSSLFVKKFYTLQAPLQEGEEPLMQK
eukprot:gnl/TRDRNA2_/TRDRNA2_198759_c0_seq1.p1 gnl/TRDRNA2_/TRDRNA2_198759_c0~~gnl/TRDRNA2_/TRDRNA2_198759_c0_seq1.p1  ORF type:complete len:157 (+),score=19.33 gnl/TRDRNA2_/TRDRNA2_198759_c0_seq1:74-544(+)